MKQKQTRHYCTYCGKKRYEKNLVLVTYYLILKSAWHCKEHLENACIATVKSDDGSKESVFLSLSTEADNSKI